MTVLTFHRGLAVRRVEQFELDDPRLADVAAQTGALAWLERVEAAAADVLERRGDRLERDRLGLLLTDAAARPDPNSLEAPGLAAKVLEYARAARIVLAGSNEETTFEWGAKLMQAVVALDLELKGWPLAAERGSKSKMGEDKATDPDLRARAIRWCDEAERGKAAGVGYKTTYRTIRDREGISFETIASAVKRERKRRFS